MAGGSGVPIKGAFALLLAWLGVGLAALLALEPGDVRLLFPLLAAAVALVGLWRPKPFAAEAAAVAGTLVWAGARFLASGSTTGLAALSVATLLVLAVEGAIVELVARQAEREFFARRRDVAAIEELTPTEGETGTLKWQYAERGLTDELGRARRYRYAVSFVLLDVADPDVLVERLGRDRARAQLRASARQVVNTLRVMDSAAFYHEWTLALILPHTPLAGAHVLVDRLRHTASTDFGLDFVAGIAEFPSDAATAEELQHEAEEALSFARGSSLPVASSTLLGGE